MSGEPSDGDALMWARVFEFYRDMPRGGPGDPESMRRALAFMTGLPQRPRVIDLGCGPGSTSGRLAALTGGSVTAFDLDGPFVAGQVARAGDAAVRGVRGDMSAAPFAPGAFDLVWSEGALYSIGFRNGLRVCAGLVRQDGYLAASEAVWTVAEPPDEVRDWWNAQYPDIGSIDAKLADLRDAGFDIVGHFTLPQSSWREHYYGPMLGRIEALRDAWAHDASGVGVLRELEHEAAMFDRFGHTYSYELIVGRRHGGVPAA